MTTATISDRIWFTTNQAAEYTGRHRQTVANALRTGELEGNQRHVGSHWRIHRDALDAWMRGE